MSVFIVKLETQKKNLAACRCAASELTAVFSALALRAGESKSVLHLHSD